MAINVARKVASDIAATHQARWRGSGNGGGGQAGRGFAQVVAETASSPWCGRAAGCCSTTFWQQ